MLTDAEREELRQELEREIANLQRTMAVTAEAARPVALDQTAVGRVSRADALQNQQLKDAVERMHAGTYGTCQRCHSDIPFGRLLVFPEARLCAPCSARSDRG
jgi:DnaK suppressor protein